jgi:hypothetical protein
MSLGTSNRDGGKTSESGHLRALYKAFPNGGIFQGLNVSQRGAGANMSVDIAIGDALIPRSDATYAHPVFNDAVLNKVVSTADPSNPRRDIVIMYVDYTVTPSTGVSNNTNGVVLTKVVAGTPAGSPVDPSGAALQAAAGSGNPYIQLARVRVGAGVTSIANSVIDDLRTFASPAMGNNADQGQLINGQIVPSVASNNLTVAIKTLAGNDPSATDPVYVRIGNTVRVIMSALSVTLNAGTNWFTKGTSPIATTETDFFAFLGYNTNTSAVQLAISSMSQMRLYSDFSTTNSDWHYFGGTGTAPAATDVFENIGRFNAILGASASYNWSLPATQIIINRPTAYSREFSFTNPGSAGGTIKWRIMESGRKEIRGIGQVSNAGAWNVVDLTVLALRTIPTINANPITQQGGGTAGGWVEFTSKSSPAAGSPEVGGFSFLTRVANATNTAVQINFNALAT